MAGKKFTNEEIRKEYDDFSRFYDIFNLPFEYFGLANLRRKLLKEAKGEILEVAVGSGRNLPYYSKECRITAVDFSSNMLKLAKRLAKRRGISAKFLIGNAEKLPFKSKKFDFVIDGLGLCTFPNPVKALREMARVCKKNGKILLLEHGQSKNKLLSRFQFWREKRRKEFGCSIRDHEDIVKTAGLKIERITRHFFGIFYLIVARP